METFNANVTIELASSLIKIGGLKKDISISYIADVDFTEVVSLLSEYIDTGGEIKLILPLEEIKDDKLSIVIETLKQIFGKYNNSVKSPEVQTYDTNADLPF